MIPKNKIIIIIGAMKCGTSSLYNYLIEHPKICACRTKEPEFFSAGQKHAIKTSLYENLWDFNPEVHHYCIEASTGYSKYPEEKNIPKRIYEYGIQPKLIYIVRNPFERIRSHFQFHHTFLKSEYKFKNQLRSTSESLINFSKYALQLDQYIKYFPQNSIYIVEFEKLIQNTKLVLSDVYNFLDLEVKLPNEFPVFNKTKKKQSIVREKVASKLPKEIKQLVPKSIKTKIKESFFKQKEFKLTRKQIEYIRSILKDDMKKLQNFYGIDVSRWGF